MLDILGDRQKKLLQLLLKTKPGLTVEKLSSRLQITRNAVRQHLAALERDGLVAAGVTKPSGGRPHQLYVLTDKGKEFFPRHYSWFAQLLVESIRGKVGSEELGKRLGVMGKEVAKQLLSQHLASGDRKEQVKKLAEVMEQIGYNAQSTTTADGVPVIEADNCVFHQLAMKNPEICQFDLALLSTFTDSKIDHQECMARGGNICRFKFTPKR
ncbi:MAG: helix-turn-helix transcriptional regulator [Burkholderiales bacterium]